jgi:hypothetical protein
MAESCSNFLNIDISKDISFDISGDISISKLLSYINLFNSYLDEININNNYCNIKNLIINFNKNKDKNIDNFVSPIVKNINTIILYYKEFDKTLLESNSMVHYYFIYAIYKSIIILFTYYYYLDNINIYLSSDTIEFNDIMNDDEPQDLGKEDNKLFTNFIKYILISVYNSRTGTHITNPEEIEELNTLKDTCISFNSVTDDQIEFIVQSDIVFILQNIYKNICVKFNAIILGINEKNIKFSYIKRKIDFIIKNKDDKYTVIRNLIITINELEIKNGISLGINDYITIPQYTTVCWYISILTGMCYSDDSKKLLLNRINESNYNTGSDENNTFINIIKYIIKNITNDHKRYSDNITDNCDFFVYFKNNLIVFLLKKLNKLRNTIHNEIISASTNDDKQIIFKNNFKGVFVNNDYYFIYLLLYYITAKGDDNYDNMLSQEITIDDLIKTNKSLGINTYGYLILNTLYNIFNVNTLFIYHILNEYKKFKNPNNPDDNPDIIFIQEIDSSEETISDNISSSSNVENIPDINYTNNKDNIIYNDNNYKLDYILYNTINTETCDITTGCGHCISCIHYDNIKYYHDSRYPLHEIICNNDINIRIPCSLIRQDWNNNTNTYFTTDKCFTRDADINSDAFNIEKKIMVSEQYIFSNKTNLIRVYVKDVKDVKGGGNNKYKSMHKKINIMNDKKIIERTIYIDNNKNKFIKINKQYENLINFKYNKKNKFYYKK